MFGANNVVNIKVKIGKKGQFKYDRTLSKGEIIRSRKYVVVG